MPFENRERFRILLRYLWNFGREWAISTVGVAVTIGLLWYLPFLRVWVEPRTRVRLTLQPYFPVPIFVGFFAGCVTWWRCRRSASFWVWVPQAAYMLYVLDAWVRNSGSSSGFSLALRHFFGGSCSYPDCRDQLESTFYLYTTMAYSLGALALKISCKFWRGMQ